MQNSRVICRKIEQQIKKKLGQKYRKVAKIQKKLNKKSGTK